MCILYSIKICSNYRGEKFRTAFARLGELRSALPSSVPVLAVTATSTKSTYNRIVKSLLMEKVCIVGLSPNRDSIFYGVIPTVSLSEFFNPIAEQLKEKGKVIPKLLYFADLIMTAMLYMINCNMLLATILPFQLDIQRSSSIG